MQELTLVLIRFAFLAILWMFVIGALSVIKSDLFGAKVETVGRDDRSRRERRTTAAATQSKRPPRGAPTQVVVVNGPSAGQAVSLEPARQGTPLLIGRGPEAAIQLDDDYISTAHARIGASGDTWYVEDLGSTNGTYLGSQRLTQPTAVQLGSQIRIGKTTLELGK